MPYTERLTWSGICLHAGSLPGYPVSHGCIHLPLEFSHLLFEVNELGATVVIADEHGGPAEAVHPSMVLSPSLHKQKKAGPAAEAVKFEWEPDRAPEGPLSLLLSTADSKLYVYRNGIEIGFTEIVLSAAGKPLVEGVHTVLEGDSDKMSPFAPGEKMHRWMSVATASGAVPVEEDEETLAERIHIPPYFAAQIYELLVPGTTLLITHRAATPATTTDADFVVIATQHPEESSE
jgi:hypothetical protein